MVSSTGWMFAPDAVEADPEATFNPKPTITPVKAIDPMVMPAIWPELKPTTSSSSEITYGGAAHVELPSAW